MRRGPQTPIQELVKKKFSFLNQYLRRVSLVLKDKARLCIGAEATRITRVTREVDHHEALYGWSSTHVNSSRILLQMWAGQSFDTILP